MPQPDSSLIWRCRRGIREMDLLLQQFVETRYGRLDEEEQKAFAELLEQPDLDIMDWIMERTVPPTHALESIVQMIRDVNSPENIKR